MGCFSSRFDQRRSAYTSDLNTVGLAFIGGDKDHPFDMFPVDRVGWAADQGKEITDSCPVDGMACTDEALTTAAYKKAFAALSKKSEELTKKYGTDAPKADAKVVYYENRYASDSAVAQLKACVDFLKAESGITTEEEAKGGDAMEMGGAMMEEEKKDDEGMMEGGDEMMDAMMMEGMEGMGMMEPPANPHKYDDDATDCKGFANVPSAFLKQMIVNPLVGDIIKSEVMDWELNHEKAKVGDYTGVAGLIGHAVSKKQEGDAAFFLSGHMEENAFAALKDVTEGETPSKAVHFPFLTVGWKTAEEAGQALALMTPAKGDYKKVIFEVAGAKSMNFLGCRQVAHKVNGTIDAAGTEADGVWTYKVTAAPMEEKSVQQWKDDVAAAAAAAKAAKDAPKEEEKKDGDMMMEGEKMEGEMMGGEEMMMGE